MDTETLYRSRLKDVMATTNHQEPSRVPVHGDITTWAIAYAGAKTADLLDDPQLLAEKWTSFLDDIYFDTQHSMGLSTPLRMMETLGSEALFISSDGVTIQHQESCQMEASDYPALIDDPKNFLINEYPLKKFPVLNDPSKPRYETLKKCAAQTLNWITANALVEKTAREKYGVFPLATGACRAYAPLDVIFDRLRGFKGLSLDMKRCPELVIAACEAIYSVYIEDTINGFPGDFPFAMSPLHSPAFIGPKKFEKFFWPTYKKTALEIARRGGKIYQILEGNYRPYYDYFRELPKSTLVCEFENYEDLFIAKKEIGDVATLIGGIPMGMLRHSSVQECIDCAKEIIDVCAPGGGFIYCTGKALLSANDVNVENLKAVNAFVHEYGKY